MKNSTMKEIITNYQDMSYDNTNSAKSEIDEMNKSLIRAVCSNDMNACTQLLQAGANANTDIANGNSPLLIAVSKSYINVNIANLLIQHGANVDFLDDNLDSLLLCAVKSGREKKKCLEW